MLGERVRKREGYPKLFHATLLATMTQERARSQGTQAASSSRKRQENRSIPCSFRRSTVLPTL